MLYMASRATEWNNLFIHKACRSSILVRIMLVNLSEMASTYLRTVCSLSCLIQSASVMVIETQCEPDHTQLELGYYALLIIELQTTL